MSIANFGAYLGGMAQGSSAQRRSASARPTSPCCRSVSPTPTRTSPRQTKRPSTPTCSRGRTAPCSGRMPTSRRSSGPVPHRSRLRRHPRPLHRSRGRPACRCNSRVRRAGRNKSRCRVQQPMPVHRKGSPSRVQCLRRAVPRPVGHHPKGSRRKAPKDRRRDRRRHRRSKPGPPGDMFQKALQTLEQAKAELSTPVAQKVLQDPEVQKSTKAYHDDAKELSGQGIGPGKGKPDAVQMKRLRLYHDQLAVSMAGGMCSTSRPTAPSRTRLPRRGSDPSGKVFNNILKGREDAISGERRQEYGAAHGRHESRRKSTGRKLHLSLPA